MSCILFSAFTLSIASGTVSLKPELISQLQSLNSSYDADYFLLITGGGALSCPHVNDPSVFRVSVHLKWMEAETPQLAQ